MLLAATFTSTTAAFGIKMIVSPFSRGTGRASMQIAQKMPLDSILSQPNCLFSRSSLQCL